MKYISSVRKQNSGENLDAYHTSFEGDRLDQEIKSQIIQNCTSVRLRRRALRNDIMACV
jgi:hypothetical protein